MITDLDDLEHKYDIVIVGSGIAGLGLSRLLNTTNAKILIFDSGDLKFNKTINQKSHAESKNLGNWPSKNYASHFSRVRMFGGNSNVWGGWCMELDEYDYSNNDVWGYLKKELIQHYPNAYKLLNITPKKISSQELNLSSVDPYVINISRGNFKNKCKSYIEENQNIDLILNTEVDKINFDANKVTSLSLKNLSGATKEVFLNKLVMSTGGFEATKILSSNIPKLYLNNNLGKFFMEHPQLQVGRVKISSKSINRFAKKYSPPTAKHLFDDKRNIVNEKYFSGFKSTNKNVRNYFVLRTSNVYQSKALYRLRHTILTKSLSATGKIHIINLVQLVGDMFDMFFRKLFSKLSKSKSYSVVLHLEQKPDKKNKIEINKNKAILDWNFTDNDFANLKKSIEDLNIIFKEMESKFILKKIFNSDKDKINNYLKKNIFGIGHHMGTTRMGFKKEDSVCDLNLKYHGIENLYINSTSVFPTGGIANPTLTLLALTSRLAENLNND